MDQKSWLWKKRSTEKTLLADKGNNSLTKNEEVTEIQKLLTEKAELERDLRTLDEKLSSALSECNAKDNIAKKQVKIAEEAIAGWEKAEIQANSLKQELEKVLQQKSASGERICHLDAALKECMQQLRFLREEQEKRVHGAVLKASEAFEKVRITLDEKLAEAGRRLAKLDAENTQLIKALSGKDKVIEDLSNYRTRLEADFHALMSRVEATEKENTSLKYEVCVLEKELDIRNEEREFNRRTAELAQKQHLESAKKIGKLEMECQRLRLLVRKRLPGPATLAKMKSEVEVLGKDQVETRRIKSNPYSTSSMESCNEVSAEQPSKRIDILIQQLHKLEEENKTLKISLNNTSSELQFSGATHAYTASSLSQVEARVEKPLKGQNIAEPSKHLHFLQERSLAASSDVGSDEKASCAESWASALISELEHFKNEKQLGTSSYRSMGTSEISLMDDFAEMEKMAVVSVEYASGSSHHSSEKGNDVVNTSHKPSDQHSSSAPGVELAPVYDCHSEPLILGQKFPSEHLAVNKVPQCPSDILKMLLDHCHVAQRNPHKVLEDMKFALPHDDEDIAIVHGNWSTDHTDASCNGSGHVILGSKSKSKNLDVSETMVGNDIRCTETSGQKFPPTVSMSIHKILDLLEGLNIHSQDNGAVESFSSKHDNPLLYKNSENTAGYIVRVFQWKTAELSTVLQQLVLTCNDLLNGMANLEQFAQQVASNLEWVINHCFSIQDVSSMKDAIRSHFDWDESMSDGEVECGFAVPSLSSHNSYSHTEALQLPKVEAWNADHANNESPFADLERKLQSEIAKGECLRIQLQESKDMIERLQSQMETVKQAGGQSGNQTEKHKMMKEDLEAKLLEITNEWKKACQKIACLEDELENKNNLCKRLEETCLELNTKLESMTSKEILDDGKHWEKQLENDWEITAASEKLAECQETILNLGKQLKALASPSDAALFDKVVPNPAESVVSSSSARRSTSQRSSLLDKMIAEDNEKINPYNRPKADIQNMTESCNISTGNGINHHKDKSEITSASMDIVPRKKKGGWSILRKLYWRRKKGNTNKTPTS